MSNFKTKCKTQYIWNSLANWESSTASIEAKFYKVSNYKYGSDFLLLKSGLEFLHSNFSEQILSFIFELIIVFKGFENTI